MKNFVLGFLILYPLHPGEFLLTSPTFLSFGRLDQAIFDRVLKLCIELLLVIIGLKMLR